MADTDTHSRLRGRIKAALKAMPGVMVTNGDASDGALDLILCVDGHYIELDIKTGEAMLSPAQKMRCLIVERNGGNAYEVRSITDAERMVKMHRGREKFRVAMLDEPYS